MTLVPKTVVCLFTFFLVVCAQQPQSRVGEIQQMRQKKAAQLAPETASKTEQNLVAFREKHILEKITYGIGGLRARVGGLVTGSGFALGPEYFRDDLASGDVRFRVTTQFSLSQYQLYDVELALPKLVDEHAFFELHATHRNFPRMDYYGQGPDSEKTGRSNYRLEDTNFSFASGVRPTRHFRAGVTGGFTEINVGPGTHESRVSTEQIYTPYARVVNTEFGPRVEPGTVGIDRQTDFLQGGVFAQFDYRDIPGGPRSGGNYLARFTYNKDVDLRQHTHRRLELEAQQYIPFFNQRRVIALRARSELTYKNRNQSLPFYMQPTLGGSNDIRGFRPFRFYDDNLIVFNAEYRYEIFSGMDMAIFGDAGKVFHSKKDWNVHDLEAAYGIGMRFNARNTVFMRVDAGFSHEGFQVWVKFNNVF
jgi:outer membrane protein assembly factor BamA